MEGVAPEEKRFYYGKCNIWRKKWYKYLQIWYFIFVIICIINIILYRDGIINDSELLIWLPFINWICSFLFIMISSGICNKYDFDYIERYYPKFAREYWPYGRSNGFRKSWIFKELYTIEDDPVIDDILEHEEKILPLHIIPFIIGVINAIIVSAIR